MAVFLILCASLGILQLDENIKLFFQEGEQLLIDHSFAALEFIWLGVSIWYLAANELSGLGVAAVCIYFAYNIFGWVVGLRAYQASEDNESGSVVVPLWYFKANMAIAAVYSATAFLAYSQSSVSV